MPHFPLPTSNVPPPINKNGQMYSEAGGKPNVEGLTLRIQIFRGLLRSLQRAPQQRVNVSPTEMKTNAASMIFANFNPPPPQQHVQPPSVRPHGILTPVRPRHRVLTPRGFTWVHEVFIAFCFPFVFAD